MRVFFLSTLTLMFLNKIECIVIFRILHRPTDTFPKSLRVKLLYIFVVPTQCIQINAVFFYFSIKRNRPLLICYNRYIFKRDVIRSRLFILNEEVRSSWAEGCTLILVNRSVGGALSIGGTCAVRRRHVLFRAHAAFKGITRLFNDGAFVCY